MFRGRGVVICGGGCLFVRSWDFIRVIWCIIGEMGDIILVMMFVKFFEYVFLEFLVVSGDRC